MEQRILLIHDVTVHDALMNLAGQAGLELASMRDLQDVLDRMAGEESCWLAYGVDRTPAERLGQFCDGLKELPELLRPYVIILSTSPRVSPAIAEIVDDHVQLPLWAGQIGQQMRRARRFIQLQVEFRRQALRDPLTGVLNRRAVLDVLERELLRSRRLDYPVAIAMVDLDHYKQVNDVHGHLAGDATLISLAGRIQTQLRPYDAVGRYGGDEFLLVLSNCVSAHAKVICERIRTAASGSAFSVPGGSVMLTLSAGIAAATVKSCCNAADLIEQADAALYQAKSAGRDRVMVAASAP